MSKRRPDFARHRRQGLQGSEVRVLRHWREIPVRMRPVELVGLGGEPVDIVADGFVIVDEVELDEIDARQAGHGRQRHQLSSTVAGKINGPQALFVLHGAIHVANTDPRL